jgi:outer membrane protein X
MIVRKACGFCLSVILFLTMMVPTHLLAQPEQGTVRLGGQVGIGTEIESFGIGLRGDYALTPKFLLASDFMYFFGDEDYGIEADWFDLNFNANYLIELRNPDVFPYILGGLNIARTSVSCDGALSPICDDFSATDIGLNLGGGLDFLLGSIALFGEIRVTLGDANQVVISTGIKLPLN